MKTVSISPAVGVEGWGWEGVGGWGRADPELNTIASATAHCPQPVYMASLFANSLSVLIPSTASNKEQRRPLLK